MSAQAVVPRLPSCDFRMNGEPEHQARFDFKTKYGPWANGCEEHWIEHRASDQLGTGHGQRLVTPDEVPAPEYGAGVMAASDELGMPPDEIAMLADDMGIDLDDIN